MSEKIPMDNLNHFMTMNLPVVEDQHKWTVFNSQVNLPAVLNDPRLSRRETDFFTKTWGESFEKTTVYPSPHLQDITREHFRRYLKRTSGVRSATGYHPNE